MFHVRLDSTAGCSLLEIGLATLQWRPSIYIVQMSLIGKKNMISDVCQQLKNDNLHHVIQRTYLKK